MAGFLAVLAASAGNDVYFFPPSKTMCLAVPAVGKSPFFSLYYYDVDRYLRFGFDDFNAI